MIKVTIGESKTHEVKGFPVSMRNKITGGVFIFFKGDLCGCIDPGDSHDWKSGECCEADIDFFEPINQQLQLQNQ